METITPISKAGEIALDLTETELSAFDDLGISKDLLLGIKTLAPSLDLSKLLTKLPQELKKHWKIYPLTKPWQLILFNGECQVLERLSSKPDWQKLKGEDNVLAVHYAARSGSSECLAWLCKQLDDDFKSILIQRDNNGLSALHYAVLSGNRDCVDWICRQLGDDTRDLLKPFHEYELSLNTAGLAIFSGGADCVAAIFETLNDTATKHLTKNHDFCRSFLHSAILSRDLECFLEVCNQLGDQVNQRLTSRDKYKRTALHLAASKGGYKILASMCEMLGSHVVRALLKTDDDKKTALHHAAKRGWQDCIVEICERLGDKMIGQLQQADEFLCTPLHYALEAGSLPCVIEICETLGPNLSMELSKRTFNKSTALHFVAQSESLPCLQEICRRVNMDVASQLLTYSKNGMTPLHWLIELHGINQMGLFFFQHYPDACKQLIANDEKPQRAQKKSNLRRYLSTSINKALNLELLNRTKACLADSNTEELSVLLFPYHVEWSALMITKATRLVMRHFINTCQDKERARANLTLLGKIRLCKPGDTEEIKKLLRAIQQTALTEQSSESLSDETNTDINLSETHSEKSRVIVPKISGKSSGKPFSGVLEESFDHKNINSLKELDKQRLETSTSEQSQTNIEVDKLETSEEVLFFQTNDEHINYLYQLEVKIEALKNKLASKERNYAQSDEVTAYSPAVKHLTEMLAKKLSALNLLESKIEKREHHHSQLKKKIKHLKKQCKQLKEKKASLTEHSNHSHLIAELKKKIAKLMSDVDALREERKENTLKLNKLQRCYDSLVPRAGESLQLYENFKVRDAEKSLATDKKDNTDIAYQKQIARLQQQREAKNFENERAVQVAEKAQIEALELLARTEMMLRIKQGETSMMKKTENESAEPSQIEFIAFSENESDGTQHYSGNSVTQIQQQTNNIHHHHHYKEPRPGEASTPQKDTVSADEQPVQQTNRFEQVDRQVTQSVIEGRSILEIVTLLNETKPRSQSDWQERGQALGDLAKEYDAMRQEANVSPDSQEELKEMAREAREKRVEILAGQQTNPNFAKQLKFWDRHPERKMGSTQVSHIGLQVGDASKPSDVQSVLNDKITGESSSMSLKSSSQEG